MNDIIFNNDIKITVVQSPEIAEDGDTVEFSATPELLFATGDRAGIENYSFTYIWMVSYDGGLTYKKIGTNTSKLVLENISTKIFNNSIYKVKVVLEDLEDFLLTESGDRILTQIGEILLFNNNNGLLSIQSDPITNDTTTTSIDNIADVQNSPLDFLSIEGTIDEAATFDDTITPDIRAEILSLQSRIDINNQAKSTDGEISVDVNLPPTPDTDIVLPSETLSIQAECYTTVQKTIGSGPTIQYEICQPGGTTYLWYNCNDSNPRNYDSEAECVSKTGACEGSIEDPCVGRYHPLVVNDAKVQFNCIKFPNCINETTGGPCTMCCDSVETSCDSTDPWNKCEEELSQSMPSTLKTQTAVTTTYYKKYDYGTAGDSGAFPSSNPQGDPHSPPCGNATSGGNAGFPARINCEQEDYIPEPLIGGRFSISNNCLSRGDGWGQDGLGDDNAEITTVWYGIEKFRYCNSHCKGKYEEVNIPGLLPRFSGLLSYLFYLAYYVGGAWTQGYFIRTYCDGNGQVNDNILPTQVSPAVIKECTLKICKQKWICIGRKDKFVINNGNVSGKSVTFSRVNKGGGPSITIDGVTYKSDQLVAPNSAHERFDGPPPYICEPAGIGGSIEFEQDEELKQNCEWRVFKKCCPTGKKCTYKVDPLHALSYPGNYPVYTFDATNRVFDRDKLYSVNRSSPLDSIKAELCNAVCSGSGCEIYEKWEILDVDPKEVPCNEDFDIKVLDEISHRSHGKNGSETTIFTDAKCVNDPTPAKRTIKVAKIVKRYTYTDPGEAGSYKNVMLEVYQRLGYVPGDSQIYANTYLVKYEEQLVPLPGDYRENPPQNSEYIKKEKDFNDGQFVMQGRNRIPKTTPLYRHSAIRLTDTLPISRWCEGCEPLYIVSKANASDYPCNDRNHTISGCVDGSGNPLPQAYGGCLKDNSNKNTKIKIVTITEIKQPTREMIRLSKQPNTDYFKSVEDAKAEGLRRVGSTGIVCAGASI